MKTTIWMQACLAVLLAGGTSARAVDPWPAESSAAAVRLTDIDPGLDTVNWSGAFWNPDTRTLWICCNSGTFWALVENGAGSFQVATNAAGTPAKWSPGGDLEAICQADSDPGLVYLLDENGWIREYDVSQYGIVHATHSWDIRAQCPEVGGTSGGEGLAFVSDGWLQREGFRQADGALRASTNGMGGLMFVGYQYDGCVYAFDLQRGAGTAGFVGRYRTGRAETAALEFDRATGKLYVWHNTGSNYLEVVELNSTVAGTERRLRPLAEYVGPRAGNLEGFALAPDGAGNVGGGCIVADDDNQGHEAVMWFRRFQPSDDTDGDGLSDAWEIWNRGTTAAAGFAPRRINCGGPAISGATPWLADTGYSGGTAKSTTSAIANATNAPQAMYQTRRYAPTLTYAFPDVPDGTYTIRLHFAELYYGAAGRRRFNVAIEGLVRLTNFDIYQAAGGKNRAVVRTFENVSVSGGLQIQGVASVDGAQFNGIEIEAAGPPAPAIVASVTQVAVPEGGTATFGVHLDVAPAGATTVTVVRASGDADIAVSDGANLVFTPANYAVDQTVTLAAAEDADTANGTAAIQCTAAGYVAAGVTATEQDNDAPAFSLKVNCGGSAVTGGWAADTGYSGGTAKSTTSAIANATNAPKAIYQTRRYAPTLTYSFPAVPDGTYTIRLHFAELYYGAAGRRIFNVAIEGSTRLTNFDIYQAAGGKYRAVVRTFENIAVSGGLQIQGVASVDGAQFNGIEILGGADARKTAVQAPAARLAQRPAPDVVRSSEDARTPDAGWAAVDGDLDTVWQAGGNWGSWICLGYDSPVQVRAIDVHFAAGSPLGLYTLASEDAVDWFELEPELELGPVELNYLWFLFPTDLSAPPAAVREIEVHGVSAH